MNQKILWHYEAKDMEDYEGKDMEADIVRLHEDFEVALKVTVFTFIKMFCQLCARRVMSCIMVVFIIYGDPFKKKSSKSTVYNLSNRILTKRESNVLELGLSFCPSQANFNKEMFAKDIFKFFRRLKLREYFFEENGKETSHLNTKVNSQANDERHDLGWFIKNEHWYPEKVREGRSTDLSDFLDNTVHEIRSYLISNKSKRINNLTNKQREALNSLASDETLIIKPADKCSGIVLMNIND